MKNAPLYAWVTMTHEGTPSLVGAFVPSLGSHIGLVGFDRANVERLRPFAVSHGRGMKQDVYLVQLDGMTILETHKARTN
jgi:hypothetical protein